jgi:hypothetical protein
MRAGVVLAAAAAALSLAPAAGASALVARDASGASLRVRGGTAVVTYRQGGRLHRVLASGAIGARVPNPRLPQVSFRLRYGASVAGGSCRRYDGPALPLLVAACKAPDGSYWALQSWQRLLRDYGGARGSFELHLSHWRGALPRLTVWQDWSYHGRFDHIFGKLTYHGRGVHGFASTHRGNPLDDYGRNLYLDTLDSAYGPGWRRDNGFLAHGPGGTFCYGLYRHGSHPSGKGRAYRLTVLGPGVTPIVRWQATAREFDPRADAQLNALERSLGDPKCRRS